jgi:CheY-like chemotaxis protein
VVRIQVSDSGVGIAPENLTKIFEPFFTTKEQGKGTGLGLAMVFGIIQQHKGWIECQSVLGRGTRFDLYLPRCLEAAAPAETAESPDSATGHETILLVDDEPMIRNLGRAILTKHGYQVLLAENGREATAIYRRDRERVDLVLLDLTMPEMSGRETLAQLRQIDGGVRVLYMSGYSSDQLSESSMAGALGFLNKPFSPKQLAATVRKTLDLIKVIAEP